jgi:hypothetical protein
VGRHPTSHASRGYSGARMRSAARRSPMAHEPASRSGEPAAIASWREARRGGWIERTGDALLYGGPLLTLGAFALLAELFPQIEDNTPLALAMLAIAPVAFMASLYGAFRLAWLGKVFALSVIGLCVGAFALLYVFDTFLR